MPLSLPEGQPQADQIAIYLPDSGQTLERFESYAVDDDWLVPCSGGRATIGGQSNPGPKVMAGLKQGAKAQLVINGLPQDTGYIDDVIPYAGRSGGKRWTVTWRNSFAPVVSGGADPFDPALRFTPTQTLDYLVTTVFGRYGFTAIDDDEAASIAIKTGLLRQRFAKKKARPLNKYKYGVQLKPTPAEGSLAYVEKIANRIGFYIRCSADGKTVVVTTPTYDQEPVARIVRHRGDNVSNVLEGGIGAHTEHQHSIIVATGFTSGGEWPKSQLKSAMVNELVGFDPALVSFGGNSGMLNLGTAGGYDPLSASAYATGVGIVTNANPDAKVIAPRNVFPLSCLRPLPYCRALFLHDQDAKSQSQLDNFVRLHMSMEQQHMWTGDYLVYGHTYFNGSAKVPWTVNTIVDVDDVDSGPPGTTQSFTGPMWVKGRTFEKSRAGTYTRLRLVLPHTLALYPVES